MDHANQSPEHLQLAYSKMAIKNMSLDEALKHAHFGACIRMIAAGIARREAAGADRSAAPPDSNPRALPRRPLYRQFPQFDIKRAQANDLDE